MEKDPRRLKKTTSEMKCLDCGGICLFRMSHHVVNGKVLCGCSLSTVPQQYVCLDCGEQFWVRLK